MAGLNSPLEFSLRGGSGRPGSSALCSHLRGGGGGGGGGPLTLPGGAGPFPSRGDFCSLPLGFEVNTMDSVQSQVRFVAQNAQGRLPSAKTSGACTGLSPAGSSSFAARASSACPLYSPPRFKV